MGLFCSCNLEPSTPILSPVSRPLSPLLLLALAAVVLLAGCSGAGGNSNEPAPPKTEPGVVAYLGETPITEAEWRQARAYAEATLRLLGEPGAELDQEAAMESFVEDRMIAREAEAQGYSLPADAVASEEERMLAVAGKTQADLDEILAQVGLTREGWETELGRAILAASYLEDVVLADVPPGERGQRRTAWLQDRKEALGIRILSEFEPMVGLQIGNLAPDFELAGLDGETLKLCDYRGQAVMLNFWATWCLPCRQEMPLFQAAYEQYQDDGLVILAANVGEDATTARNYADELGLSFDIGLDQAAELSRAYRVFGMPTTFFINRQGVIDYLAIGAVRESDLDDILARILETDDDD